MNDAVLCRSCRKPLLKENWVLCDGCPCNSPRGVNHGIVPKDVCTCSVCDPTEGGCSRYRQPEQDA